MTHPVLYLMIGFVFAVIGYLRDSFGSNYEKNEKKVKEMLEFSPINMSMTQVRLLAFAFNILLWPVGLFMMIEDATTGDKDDD